ncbi:hypothetical protein R69608_03528 [Paraburkholderia nemoris]|uniref:hypothetical protein n=1 Tax=Paraburkholderia nemoris TaxID=2793076 RepID=UPI001911D726|nr:hypothetical protein [Paraburkholderia nemoris]MBK5148953.1 hypothetical protein [Burkholderia sp. R-69608]CAE6911105.1 hypothetical protein R69608_03528 [Paraburkholderia nemoris]
MSSGNDLNPAAKHSPLQKRLYLAGVVVLLAGLIAGAIIYAMAPAPDSAVSMYSIADPRYQIELQRIGGNAAVVMAQLHQWFDSLWHGTALAYTVAVLGALLAGACFFIGYFFADEEPQT